MQNTNDITKLVYGLVILGILLGVGFMVLGSFATSSVITSTSSFVNQSYNITGSGVLVQGAGYAALSYFNTILINGTNINGGALISSSNYTIDSAGLLNFTATTNRGYFGHNWNLTASYSYNSASNATGAINQVISTMQTIPNTWLAIIVIVAMAGLIIYLVSKGFGGISGFGGSAK